MPRLNYYQVAPEPFQKLGAVTKYLETCGLDPALRLIVEIRVSQINGCAYCVDLHTRQARDHGVEQKRLDVLPVWRETVSFSAAECAALAWAEAVTHISESHASDDLYAALQAHFSEKEITDLTAAISLMNAWNRISVSFKNVPAA